MSQIRSVIDFIFYIIFGFISIAFIFLSVVVEVGIPIMILYFLYNLCTGGV